MYVYTYENIDINTHTYRYILFYFYLYCCMLNYFALIYDLSSKYWKITKFLFFIYIYVYNYIVLYYYCICIYIVNGCKTYAVIKTSYMRCFKMVKMFKLFSVKLLTFKTTDAIHVCNELHFI